MFLKRLVPKFILKIYHFKLAVLAAALYRFPADQLIVIGVTGTGGKSTVVNLIAKILEEAGYKVGLTSTLNFKIGEKEWTNATKMTMLGRFGLQKLLRQMVKEGCQYAVVETSSEGIAQYRHIGINYDVAVFTNLTPEHIERHGSFEIYKKMKGKLFARLSKGKKKYLNGKKIRTVSVVNLDDEHADYFLRFPAEEKWGYSISEKLKAKSEKINGLKIVKAENMKLSEDGSQFTLRLSAGEAGSSLFTLHFLGEFNVYNALAAICVGLSQGMGLNTMKKALEKVNGIPGRMEKIDEGQNFTVFVDYAHTPDSLEKVYQVVSLTKPAGGKIIGILGSAGGGRDAWKRPETGAIAAKYCDTVILTNEDPYDEDPAKILSEIKSGISGSNLRVQNLYEILDRREAIKKALESAGPGDIAVITGKGCEQCIMGPNGTREPWDDRKVAREVLKEIKKS